MRLTKAIKTLVICGSVLAIVAWLASTKSSKVVATGVAQPPVSSATPADANDYVGSDACKDCHED